MTTSYLDVAGEPARQAGDGCILRDRRWVLPLPLCFFLVSAFSGSVLALPSAALLDKEARGEAIAAVRSAAKWLQGSKLYTRRHEEFESDFLEYQIGVNEGKNGQGIYVYEVSEAGCDLELPERGGRTCSVVMDADPRWYVGVSRESGLAYRLSGFDDAHAEFNRMAKDLRVRIRKDADATEYGELFLRLLYGPETDLGGPHVRLAPSESSMMQTVQHDFCSCYQELECEKRFLSWRKRFKSLYPKPILEPKTVSGAEGHDVQVLVVRLIRFTLLPFKRLDKEPVLEGVHLRISLNGEITIAGTTVLFPREAR